MRGHDTGGHSMSCSKTLIGLLTLAAASCSNPTAPPDPLRDAPVWEDLAIQRITEDSPPGTMLYRNLKTKAHFEEEIFFSVFSGQNIRTYFEGNDLLLASIRRDYAGTDTIAVLANSAEQRFILITENTDDPASWTRLEDKILNDPTDGTIAYPLLENQLYDPDNERTVTVIRNNPSYELYYEKPDLRIRNIAPRYAGTDSAIVNGNGERAGFLLTISRSPLHITPTLEKTITLPDNYEIGHVLTTEQFIIINAWHDYYNRDKLYVYDKDDYSLVREETGNFGRTYMHVAETPIALFLLGTWDGCGDSISKRNKTTFAEEKRIYGDFNGLALAVRGERLATACSDEFTFIDQDQHIGPYSVIDTARFHDLTCVDGIYITGGRYGIKAGIAALASNLSPLFQDTVDGHSTFEGHAAYATAERRLLRSETATKLYDTAFRLIRQDSWQTIQSAAMNESYIYINTVQDTGMLYDTNLNPLGEVPLDFDDEDVMGFSGDHIYGAKGNTVYIYALPRL